MRLSSLIYIKLNAHDKRAGGSTYKVWGTLETKIAAYPLLSRDT